MNPSMQPSPRRLPHLPGTRTPQVLVIGAGVGGLCAAALLAHQGLSVRVLEQAAQPGGKLGRIAVGPLQLDAGPTVLTMRWVFDALFDALGLRFDACVALRRCEVLARHTWGDDRLDLLADLEASVDAIGRLSGAAEAARYRGFCVRSAAVFRTLDRPFLQGSRPNPLSLAARVGWRHLPELAAISPFRSLWNELGRHFHDPRLRQLFGRYATYCGSSPFEAPATLMLVAHVERESVWQLDGGMHALALALDRAARWQGVQVDCGQAVAEVLVERGRARGVRLASGERLMADAVLFNGDARALQQGLLGADVQAALGRAPALPQSLSALTWHLEADIGGRWQPSHHNVVFSPPENEGYRREFDAIAAGRLPEVPTVYLCAQDRDGRRDSAAPNGPERLMCLVNAPAQLGNRPLGEQEISACEQAMWQQLARSGLTVRPTGAPPRLTRPTDFAQRYPGSLGALYGPSSRGWRASFQRPAHTTRLPGLFLAGGTVHPGPGVPMAALSGRLAATQILADLASTSRSRPVAMPGGMSTP
ncbi:1-hydroxycarotenoid 3,4-desaturase CrtD [Leptothrix discophora]|uniref:Phytoene desaturase family protein n=1 Tax=Leptothrix discophora TaxID=89 RepID=A0ABT9G4H3_LEPDI|nr:1-hydroxycarotenoid 3,4-desaturase CrtD [Leptothrix discophora]MDP4301394.1 phytoene desaturase family protein [Leptothrix discophora]